MELRFSPPPQQSHLPTLHLSPVFKSPGPIPTAPAGAVAAEQQRNAVRAGLPLVVQAGSPLALPGAAPRPALAPKISLADDTVPRQKQARTAEDEIKSARRAS